MASQRITAVICTHNRSAYLRKAIGSLVEQSLPVEEYEILVVDNASTDDTRQVVCGEFGEVPNLRYLHEPVLGLSRARNTGWRNAQGEYVAYLDDDTIAAPCWAEKIVEVFDTVRPMPGCVGGKVEPIWQTPRPGWLDDSLAHSLAVVDWSSEPRFLENHEWLAGCNVAYPKHLLDEVDGFSTTLGRKGRCLLSNEEILLIRQLECKGFPAYYHPEISIQHHIPASRLTRKWFIRRAYWQGVSDASLCVHWPDLEHVKNKLTVFEVVRRLCTRRRLSWLLLPTGNAEGMQRKCSVWWMIGWAVGLLRFRRSVET